MLKSKHVLCPVCGEVFTEACYGNHKRRERLILKHNMLQEFYVEPLSGDTATSYKLQSHKMDISDGMPERIRVQVDEGKPEEFSRCCPKCSTLTLMPRYWGKVPSFVVCVAAMPGEGKTCLYTAMATSGNLSALASAGYPWRLTTTQMETGVNMTAAHTPMDSIGATKVFHIRAREDLDENQPPLANILFRDSPGELFERGKGNSDNAFFKFLQKHDAYPGPDALIFLHSAEKSDDSLVHVYATLRDSIPKWPPTAVVVTHADKIRNWTQTAGDGTQVPLLTEHTFPVCQPGIAGSGYYAPSQVNRRRTLQDSIIRRHYYSMFNKDFPIIGDHTRCFLVKSCYQDAEGKLQYDLPINVMDPVIWLLNDCLLQPREEIV